jgi:hypothetical protein
LAAYVERAFGAADVIVCWRAVGIDRLKVLQALPSA